MKTLLNLFAASLLTAAVTPSAGQPVVYYSPPIHDDVNSDGHADILFQGGNALAYWLIDFSGPQPVISSAYAGNGGAGYRVVAVSDFDGDYAADVLWSNGSHLKLWVNDGAGSYTPVSVGNYGGGWEPFAAGDINGDRKSDLFFRGSTHLAYWLMDGPRVTASSYAGDGGAGFRVVAINDFTRVDNSAPRAVEVLWTNGSQLKLWSNEGAGLFRPVMIGSYGGGWEPFAAGDVDADERAEILFRGGTHIAYWTQTGSESGYQSHYAGNGGLGFRAIGVSDYQGVGWPIGSGVLWSNGSQLKLWRVTCPMYDWDYGCGTPEFVPEVIGTYGGGWQPLEMLISEE